MTGGDKISLKEYFEVLLKERDLYYIEKIKHLEALMSGIDVKHTAAVQAVKELQASIYTASEKAILKAEEQQKELNIKNNEFRAQLKDQAEVLMPRNESQTLHKNSDEKISGLKKDFDAQLELIRRHFDEKTEFNRKSIQELREAKSMGEGKSTGVRDFRDFAGWGVAILLGLLALAQYLRP